MREILFRGKDIYGKWLYGDLISLTNEIKQICNHTQLEHAHGVDIKTVGQYTCLTDKNGKKIFEGDIIACGIIPCEVKWDKEEARFCLYKYGITKIAGFNQETMNLREVVGNVIDNPELMKGAGQ